MESVDNVDFSKVDASSVKEEAGNIMKGVSKDMIILAYDKPKMSTKSNQQEYVTEFGDMFYSQCIQN